MADAGADDRPSLTERETGLLRDDRVASILTGLVIVVAMLAALQRADPILAWLFGDHPAPPILADDEARVAAGGAVLIRVLANDANLGDLKPGALRVATSPSCGAAEAAEDAILYVASDLCAGRQVFAYCVARGDECPAASVVVTVEPAPARPRSRATVPARGAPARKAAKRPPDVA